MFAIAWEYLLGRSVAADVTDREVPEWPPHPDRLFQALVAAWGERGEDEEERLALEWLESQPPPALAVPPAQAGASPKVYVPVNDTRGGRGRYGPNQLPLLPSRRTRKERRFPATLVGDAAVACVWEDARPGAHLAPLRRLVSSVGCLGHSSSLVRAWCPSEAPEVTLRPAGPGEAVSEQLRVPAVGRLEHLVRCFAGGGAGWRRSGPGAWRAYTRLGAQAAPRGEFSERLLVFRRVGGAPWSLPQTLDIARAFRGALLSRLEGRPLALFSGHAPDGSPLRAPHVAYLPLAFVGHRHADGHLLGVALAMPSGTTYSDEDALFESLAALVDPETNALPLRLPGGRETWLALETREAPPLALRAETWCAPARVWDTVTPLALDRHPPRRCRDRDAFAVERIQIELERQGLPAAKEVRVAPVSALEGAPSARSFPRIAGPLGPRGQRHVRLRFSEPVGGPLVLGAGRYRGHGLFKPAAKEWNR